MRTNKEIEWEQIRNEQGTWLTNIMAHALISKGLEEMKGHVVHDKIQSSFFVGSATAARYILAGEGLAGEGWDIKSEVIAGICTEFSKPLFEAVVNSV